MDSNPDTLAKLWSRRNALAAGLGALGVLSLPPRAYAQATRAFRASGTAAAPRTDALAALLRKVVHPGTGGKPALVDYTALSHNRPSLEAIVARMTQAKPTTMRRKAQMAYWANLYNALTLLLVARHYPVKSIRDIKLSGFFRPGPWKAELIKVEGVALSLDAIEHDIMRPVYQDARAHYALNCAAIGCPDLIGVWHEATLDAEWDAAARAYVNAARGVRLEENGGITLSSIYKWFAEDFGDSLAGVGQHLSLYAKPPLRARLATLAQARVRYAYDWSLNDWKQT